MTDADHDTVRGILQRLGLDELIPHTLSDRIDRVVLHPVLFLGFGDVLEPLARDEIAHAFPVRNCFLQ